jgi:hypothetical protein
MAQVNPKILTVADVTALQAKGRPDSLQILVEGNGIYNWASSGTPNGSTIFSATGGGVWKKVLAPGGGNALLTLTDAATTVWNYNSGNCAEWTIGGNRTLSITNVTSGVPYFGILKITQGTGGNFIPVLPGNSDDVVWRLDEGEINVIGFYYDGTSYHWSSSHSVQGIYIDQLAVPANFAATAASATVIDLVWDAVTDATLYRLQRSTDPTFRSNVTLIYTGSGTSFSDTGLTATTQYYYRIKAKASGFADSLYAFAEDETSAGGPVYLTWNSIDADAEQYNSNKGIRKKASASNGWNIKAWSNETIVSGQSFVMIIDSTTISMAYVHNSRPTDAGNGCACGGTDRFGALQIVNGPVTAFNGNTTGVPTGVTVSTGDWLRFLLTGSTLTLERSTNSGGSWTTIHTFSGSAPSPLYFGAEPYSTSFGFSELRKA